MDSLSNEQEELNEEAFFSDNVSKTCRLNSTVVCL